MVNAPAKASNSQSRRAQARTSSPGGRSRPSAQVPNAIPATGSRFREVASPRSWMASTPGDHRTLQASPGSPPAYLRGSCSESNRIHEQFLQVTNTNFMASTLASSSRRVGPELQPSAHSRVLSPPTRTHHGMYLGDAISRKTSTDKVHAIAHRPRCNLQDG